MTPAIVTGQRSAVRPERSCRAAAAKSKGVGLIAAIVLLAGCGDTLVDHTNTAIQEVPGGGAICGEGLVACGDPAAPVCTTQDVRDPNGYVCGTSCQPCPAPPANSTVTCTQVGVGGHDGVCGFDCAPGFLNDGAGCAAPALVAAGGTFSCATAAGTGEVHCWGANDKGQLGPGVATASRATAGKVQFAALTGVTALAAGPAHACAAAGGTVYCWGDQTGFGGSQSNATPAAVPALAGASALAAGAGHTCALVNGAVRCVGAGANGGGSPSLSGVTEITAGDNFSCAVAAGVVRCWGADDHGQSSGSGSAGTTVADSNPSSIPFPASAPAGLVVTHVAAGATHACAGTNDTSRSGFGTFCWGDNRQNQLGKVTGTIGAPTAFQLNNKNLSTTASIPVFLDAGGATTCAVKSDGTDFITCWGGDNAAVGGAAPAPGETVDLTAVSPPGRYSVGGDHSCIVNPAGRLACWGQNASGQLGDGTTTTPAVGTFVLVIDR